MKTKKDSPKKNVVAKVTKPKKSAVTTAKKATTKKKAVTSKKTAKTVKKAPKRKVVSVKQSQTKKGAKKDKKQEPREKVDRADRKAIKNHKKKLENAVDLVLTQEPVWFGVSLHTDKSKLRMNKYHINIPAATRARIMRNQQSPWFFDVLGFKIIKEDDGTEREWSCTWHGYYECEKKIGKREIRQSKVPENIFAKVSDHYKKYSISSMRFNQVKIDQRFIDLLNKDKNKLNPSDNCEIRSCIFYEKLGREGVKHFLLSLNSPSISFIDADSIIESVIDEQFMREFVYEDIDCSLEVANTSVLNRWSASDDLLPTLSHFKSFKLRSMILEPSQLAKLLVLRMQQSKKGGDWKISISSDKITASDFTDADRKKVDISTDDATIMIKAKDNGMSCNVRFTPSTGGSYTADFEFVNENEEEDDKSDEEDESDDEEDEDAH